MLKLLDFLVKVANLTHFVSKCYNGSKTPGPVNPGTGRKNPASEKKLALAFLYEGVEFPYVPALIHGAKLGNDPPGVLQPGDIRRLFHGGKGGAKLLHLHLLLFQPLGPAQQNMRPAAGALAEITLSAGRSAGLAKVLEFHVIRLEPALVAF